MYDCELDKLEQQILLDLWVVMWPDAKNNLVWVRKTTREEFAAIMYFDQNIELMSTIWCCVSKRGGDVEEKGEEKM